MIRNIIMSLTLYAFISPKEWPQAALMVFADHIYHNVHMCHHPSFEKHFLHVLVTHEHYHEEQYLYYVQIIHHQYQLDDYHKVIILQLTPLRHCQAVFSKPVICLIKSCFSSSNFCLQII